MVGRLFLSLITGLILIAVVSCNTVEQEPNYTYSIDSVWWSDSIDANANGYVSFKRLNFDVHLAENVSKFIEGRVYYKLEGASNFSFYAFSKKTEVTGNNADNLFYVSIGTPNVELQRGLYDFNIEIYERGKDKLEAATGSKDSLVLYGNKFEESSIDNNYTLSAWWDDGYDRDGDGYWRYANLVIDAGNDANVTRTMTAKIYYKDVDSTNYTLYHTISDFTIIGQTEQDTVSWYIGKHPDDLESGLYDFRINLYEAGSNNLVKFIDQETPVLKDVKFETEEEDSYYFSIDKVWWSDTIDVDGDSFTQLRKLNFDVNVDRNQTYKIFAKIFVRHPDSTDYEKYDSTASFNITGSSTADAYSTFIGAPPSQLDSASYDFLISIYEDLPDTLKVVETAVSAETVELLKGQNFETTAQDTTGTNPKKIIEQ